MYNLAGVVTLLSAGELVDQTAAAPVLGAIKTYACRHVHLPMHLQPAASQAPLVAALLCPAWLPCVPASHLGACHIPSELGGNTPQIPIEALAYRAMTTVLQACKPDTPQKP